MTNSQFWEQYKAKCAEKGLAPHYESEEEFSKAMTQPSKPYSTDDLVANKEEQMQDNDEFEGMYSLMQQSHGFVEEEYLEDFKENTKGKDMAQKVEWLRCIECNEMKEDTEFARLPNGKPRAICKKCMGDKIKNGHKKREERIDIVKEIVDKGTICIPDVKPFLGVDASHSDMSDAIAFSLQAPLLKERKPLKAMSEEALRNLLRLAFLAGVESVNVPEPEDVTQEMAMELLNDVISQCKGARA